MATHHLDGRQPRTFWDNDHVSWLTIQPGDTVIFETLEGLGQVPPTWTSADLAGRDCSLAHTLTGPVAVAAEPGDTLVVESLDVRHKAGAGRPSGLASSFSPTSFRTTICTTARSKEKRASSARTFASRACPSAA